MTTSVIAAVFTDGGVIGKNPSEVGGTWAFCHVGADGKRLRDGCGVVQPSDVGLPAVTNNLTELLAAVLALEGLPEEWEGTFHTDSLVTLYRVRGYQRGEKPSKFNGIPDSIRSRLESAVDRLGRFTCMLLGGHPSKKDLARGSRADGTPVSIHNVYCDQICSTQARKFLAERSTA